MLLCVCEWGEEWTPYKNSGIHIRIVEEPQTWVCVSVCKGSLSLSVRVRDDRDATNDADRAAVARNFCRVVQ